MKDSPNVLQSNPYSGTSAFGNLCTQSDEKGFNIAPRDIGSLRFLEDGLQRLVASALHDGMISQDDTVRKRGART
jgi:hypothetical protein